MRQEATKLVLVGRLRLLLLLGCDRGRNVLNKASRDVDVHVLRVFARRNGELRGWSPNSSRLSLSLMRFTGEACACTTPLRPLLLGCPDSVAAFSVGRMLHNVDERLRWVTVELLVAAPCM